MAAAAYCFHQEVRSEDERERLILEHLPQVRLIARRIHERLPAAYRYVSDPEENSPVVQLERAELERLITASIERIPAVERTVLSLYYFEELTLREVGDVMGLHFSRVSQIKSQAVLRLRNSIGARWPGVRA